jgi:hypothetical protein
VFALHNIVANIAASFSKLHNDNGGRQADDKAAWWLIRIVFWSILLFIVIGAGWR